MILKSIITRKITSTITDIPLCFTTHLLHLLVCLVFNFMCTLIVFFSVKFFRNRVCLGNRLCRHSRAIDSTRHCLDSAGLLDCLDLGHWPFSSSPHVFGVLLCVQIGWLCYCQILHEISEFSLEERSCLRVITSVLHILPECSIRIRERSSSIAIVFFIRFLSHVFISLFGIFTFMCSVIESFPVKFFRNESLPSSRSCIG